MTNNTFTLEKIEKIGLLETIKPCLVPLNQDKKIEHIMLYQLSVNDGTQIYDIVAEDYMLDGLTENMAVSFTAIPLKSCILDTHLKLIKENQEKYRMRESNGEEQEFTTLCSLFENDTENTVDTSKPQNLSQLISEGQLFSKKPKLKLNYNDLKNISVIKLATNIDITETTYFVDKISTFTK